MTINKIALFIDADNISAKFGKQIIEALESRGEIFIRRIYGNWEKIPLHGWNECILNYSLRPVQQTDFATGKNATDMSLTIDAMDVLYGGKANIFALVSNDSDFTPLAIRLREGGMNVIGIGTAQVSNAFRSACSEFIYLGTPVEEVPIQPSVKVQILKPPPKVEKKSAPIKIPPIQLSLFEDSVPPVKEPPSVAMSSKVISLEETENDKLRQIYSVLCETAKTHGDTEGFTNLGNAGTAIAQKNLSVKSSGYSTLSKFVAAFPNLYEVKTEGGATYYRCRVSQDKLQPIHDVLRETAKAQGNTKGFVDLTCAGQNIHDKNLSIKGSGHSTLSKFVAAFPKLYEVKMEGKSVYYRCR